MTTRAAADAYTFFSAFEPIQWYPRQYKPVYSVRRDHGVPTSYRCLSLSCPENSGKSPLEKTLIEYHVNGLTYDLYTVQDYLDSSYPFNEKTASNVIGDIAERISRRVVKYFLRHYDSLGKTGGLFSNDFDPHKREGYIVENTDQYILKIKNYPNLVLLRNEKQEPSLKNKYGYRKIKELDGLFDYRLFHERHLMVLETKVQKSLIKPDELVQNLFNPLRELFPDCRFSYILFTDAHSLFHKKNQKRRSLKTRPLHIYKNLKQQDISTLFFSFNEPHDEFLKMRDHLITQHKQFNNENIKLKNGTTITEDEIIIKERGVPIVRLIKDKNGLYKKVR
ncbi:MAG: hypothetical protein ACQESG_02145 [Nanobdellota archaeon]